MPITNTSQNTILAKNVEVADTAISRLKGLLGRDGLPEGGALIITQCRSIHMFFMRFAIDVVFVDKHDKVVGIVERIRPFCFSPYFFSSKYCIELPEGTISRTRTQKGDKLSLGEVSV